MHDVSCKSDHCPIEFSIRTQEDTSINRDASVETMNVDCGDDSFKLIKSEKTDEHKFRAWLMTQNCRKL